MNEFAHLMTDDEIQQEVDALLPEDPKQHPGLIEERVERGIALLDVIKPGWHNKVDSWKLDENSETRCVLGQIYGSYKAGLAWIDYYATRPYNPAWFGFDLADDEAEVLYEDLTVEWRAEVNRRRYVRRRPRSKQ